MKTIKKYIVKFMQKLCGIDGEYINSNINTLRDDVYNLKKHVDDEKKQIGLQIDCIDNILNKNIFLSFNNKIQQQDLNELIKNSKQVIGIMSDEYLNTTHSELKILFDNKVNGYENSIASSKADLFYLWGMKEGQDRSIIINKALQNTAPIIFVEDGFIRSILPWSKSSGAEKFKHGHSFTLDISTAYINAFKVSTLERLLNSDLKLDAKEIERSKNIISKLIDNKISKYNHQKLVSSIEVGDKNKKKILVIDQSYGDMSVELGMANADTFKEMLESAISENLDADIIVKTHPDAIGSKSIIGYYSDLKSHDNVYVYSEEINPIELINAVDKVYVCTSQMGFEAALCGKTVEVFGMPFYAGWGITNDRIKLNRRTTRRTVEEIFYITYVLYSRYVSFKQNKVVDIETAIDEIIELRNEYFQNENRRKTV